jgi:quercetin dioxygenase-like cupin family protein
MGLVHGSARLVAALAIFAGVLPCDVAFAQVPVPGFTTFSKNTFAGISTPASSVELVQAVMDYAPGAKLPANTLRAPRVFTVIEGELTVRIGAGTDVYAAGKGAPVPAGTAVTITNASTTASARVFVSTLLPAGARDRVLESGTTNRNVMPKATFVSRIPMYRLPAVVELVQLGYRFDVGYATPNHVMMQPHLQTITEGECSYNYLDGASESYGPGEQAQMYVGRPGNMAASGQVSCVFLMTWVKTSAKPYTVLMPANRQ